MTNKEKELLLKDLCARSPYTVKCCVCDDVYDAKYYKNLAEVYKDKLTSSEVEEETYDN